MSEFKLPNRKVLIKPIIRQGKWLDKGHSGNFLYDNAKMYITVPISKTGNLVDPLTKEERSFFESRESGLDFNPGDLSANKKSNPKNDEYNYWSTYSFVITKNQSVVDDNTVLTTLDLSNPMDYIAYKVLISNSGPGGTVAPSWENKYDQGTYRIAVVEDSYDIKETASRASKKGKAYAFFNNIMNSQIQMYELLTVYWLENRDAAKPAVDSKIEWLRAEIENIIENKLDTFLKLIGTDYEEKLLIHRGIQAGVIKREGDYFVNIENIPIGTTMTEVIYYFKDERHQEDKLKLIALIEKD